MPFKSFVSRCIAWGSLLLLPCRLDAQPGIGPSDIERVGQSGWQFLKINGDARQAANWTMAGICAHESAMKGGQRVQVPVIR